MAKKNKKGRDLHGLLVLDKPQGLSSNQALQQVKRLFNANKAGHAGTLDPLATGVLVLCFGRATKIVEHIVGAGKTYHVIAKLGEQTDSGDREGEVIAKTDVQEQQLAGISQVVDAFIGDIEQIPPMYSALKKNGVPLYKLAREGKQVERAARTVHIADIKIENIKANNDGIYVSMLVSCSKGTYIRSLVEDIGAKLGCYAHVAELRRLSVGKFGSQHPMLTQHELEYYVTEDCHMAENALLQIEAAFLEYPRYEMKNGLLLALEQGAELNYPTEIKSNYMRIYDTDQVFRGLGTRDSQQHIHFSKQF